MNLLRLKAVVDRAVEYAAECEADPKKVEVTLSIDNSSGNPIWSSDCVKLHYDNNGMASGCVIEAYLETESAPGPRAIETEEKVFDTNKGHPGAFCDEVDASLIAASPELLEALIEVVRIADRKTKVFDRAKAAIAKAKGEAES